MDFSTITTVVEGFQAIGFTGLLVILAVPRLRNWILGTGEQKKDPEEEKKEAEEKTALVNKIDAYHEEHINRLDKIENHLAVQNGRIGKSEKDIVRLKTIHERDR